MNTRISPSFTTTPPARPLRLSRPFVRALTLVVLLAGTSPAFTQAFWINEFHYDNTGTDTGEFVEVVAPASFASLATVKLTLYNGADGTPYGNSHPLSTFTPGITLGGLRFYSKLIGGLQNGAPDGFSLDLGGVVQDFISYEGQFRASTGPAAGQTSRDVAFVESETTPVGASVGLTGLGDSRDFFVWNTSATATPGSLNTGQATSAVPEPQTWSVVAGLTLGGFALARHRSARRRAAPPVSHP